MDKYDRKSGFQTPEISLPFKASRNFSGCEKAMARPTRSIHFNKLLYYNILLNIKM